MNKRYTRQPRFMFFATYQFICCLVGIICVGYILSGNILPKTVEIGRFGSIVIWSVATVLFFTAGYLLLKRHKKALLFNKVLLCLMTPAFGGFGLLYVVCPNVINLFAYTRHGFDTLFVGSPGIVITFNGQMDSFEFAGVNIIQFIILISFYLAVRRYKKNRISMKHTIGTKPSEEELEERIENLYE